MPFYSDIEPPLFSDKIRSKDDFPKNTSSNVVALNVIDVPGVSQIDLDMSNMGKKHNGILFPIS